MKALTLNVNALESWDFMSGAGKRQIYNPSVDSPDIYWLEVTAHRIQANRGYVKQSLIGQWSRGNTESDKG